MIDDNQMYDLYGVRSQTFRLRHDAALRLAQAAVRLEEIELVRSFLEDPLFARSAEEQIIRRELVELEMQYADEELERVCGWDANGE
jgi:hypothetical protein